jgi:hypothetical protein
MKINTAPQPVPPDVLKEIMRINGEANGLNEQEIIESDDCFRYSAYFPEYITDCPGYAGPVVVVVFPAGPEVIGTFIKVKEKWKMIN